MKHLFIGGCVDGCMIDVPAGKNFVDFIPPHPPIALSVLYSQKPPPRPSAQQYHRRRIDTRNGPVDVFTHGVPCPIAALIAAYPK